jgi:hypothetical protein
MLLNKELASAFFDAWTADQNHPHRDRNKRAIPSLAEFEIFLDTMFQATLLKEEGISVISSVAWVSKEDFLKFEIPKYRQSELWLCFDIPIEFTPKNLAKMSGISNGKTSLLLVSKNEECAEIWGICYFENGLETIGSIPAAVACSRHFAPDFPTITTLGVGSLEVSRGNSRIGRVENGTFLVSHPDALTYDMAGKYLLKLIGIEIDSGAHCYKDSDEATIARTYLSCIEYLIEVLSQRKQAATVIYVSDKKKAQDFYDSSWAVTGSLEIDVLQENKIKFSNTKDPSGSLFDLKVSRTLCNRLNNIADLAKMDGALLLSPHFNVLAFGAKLKAEKWEGKIEQGAIPFSNSSQTIDFKRLGTRHNSALNFVGKVEGAVAFVSSSDGPIRVMTRDINKGTIFYWPDCRESMFK